MTEAITLDEIDQTAASVFEGYVVRKDLAKQFKGAYPVPTYVGEFLIGRYCATTDPEEIEEGLQVVRRLLADRTVRAGEEELFKSRARERMTIKLIDLVKARLDAKSNAYVAELPSLGLRDVRIDDAVVRDNERMLTGGFYAEVDLFYDAAIAEENNGKPFAINSLRPISALHPRLALTTGGRSLTVYDRAVEAPPAPISGFRARATQRAGTKRSAIAYGPVRAAELQHGRVGPTRHR